MTIRAHIASVVIGVIVCGGLVAFNSDRIESSGFSPELAFFLAINIGWIIPRLMFAFIFRATCPKCGSHALHKTDLHPKPIHYVCEKCGYAEKTIWTQGRNIP